MELFGFIGPGHAFFSGIEQLRHSLAASPPKPDLIRSLLRVDFNAPEPQLKWAYCSRQYLQNSFRAATCLYRASRLGTRTYNFPDDPKLKGLADFLIEFPKARALRYVPRRRLTLSTGDRIAKIIRPTEAPEVIARLRAVEHQSARAPFSIPRLIDVQLPTSPFFQELLPGQPLDRLINSSNFVEWLREAGKVTCQIHQLDPAGLPLAGTQVENLEKDLMMISLFEPELKSWLSSALENCESQLSTFPADGKFCHGDLRASHFLFGDQRPSIIDFDGACSGDSHWELALFITSLKREVPIFAEPQLHSRAEEAYLFGYEREGCRVNREKLRWRRLAAEVHFLARSFQRDLFTPELLQQSISAISRLSGSNLP